MRLIIIIFLGSLTLMMKVVLADNNINNSANNTVGWHWYNEAPILKDQENQHQNQQDQNQAQEKLYKQFQALPASSQLKILQEATTELKDKAVLTGNVNDIESYKKAQDMWVNKATIFTTGWEKMLLLHPELDYSLIHSHENAMAPIMQQDQLKAENKAIDKIAKDHGILLFYRSQNAGDALFAKVVQRLCKAHHISLLTVLEDKDESASDQLSNLGLSDPSNNASIRFDLHHQHANALGVHYFPAVMLVNPATGSHQIIAYGYLAENELKERLFNIENNFKPNF